MYRAIGLACCGLASCYRPSFSDCTVECVSGRCPSGLVCSKDDNRCHRPDDPAVCPPPAWPDSGPAADADPSAPDGAPPSETMIRIPAGPFWMGCSQAQAVCSHETDEKPYHQVTLSAYRIDPTEVTEAQYGRCVDAGVCKRPPDFAPAARPNVPVHGVSWAQASQYCAWAQKRLPTEAEWEKAARGDDGRTFPWGEAPATCTLANFLGCEGTLRPVGTYPAGASPYGALEMAGNVWEWVQDWYDASYYRNSPAIDPTGPATGTERGLRSGGYQTIMDYIITPNRWHATPDTASEYYGVRCAASP